MASFASLSSCRALLLFFLTCTCFLLSLSKETNKIYSVPFSFSFDFTNASSYQGDSFVFEGNASVHGSQIDLTCDSFGQSNNGCTGRMLYGRPVPLYDDTTLACFSTSFTFKIDYQDQGVGAGDGLAFFLSASYPSPSGSMPPNSSGGFLGLRSEEVAPYGSGQFVAVEFDTYKDGWNGDPSNNHIGIDVNDVRSLNTTDLETLNMTLNGTMTATIEFDNITRMLVASLLLHDHPSMQPVVVSQVLPDPRTTTMFLPRQVAVGFSASTGAATELHKILTWSFNSTLPATTTPNYKGNDLKKAMSIAAVAVVLLVVVAWLILSCWRWKNRHQGFEKLAKQEHARLEYHDLASATGNFSEKTILGQGFFGVVYRGYSKILGCEVAVKEILKMGPDNKDFYLELNTITSVKHKNLVKLVGWCRGNSWSFAEFMCWCWKNNNNRLFLVYELVPRGNLYDHLLGEETLTWQKRYKIVKDIACALVYLHHHCDPFILHRDIKPSNILLDQNFNAKLADFGLSRIVDPDNSKILTLPVGTEGYLDPQCKKPVGEVEFSRSSDVYSFGIVLLEIACGIQVQGVPIRERVWQLYTKSSLLQAADDKLNGEFDRSEMESVIIVGLWCSCLDKKKRPTMEQVMAVLEHGRTLPDLNSLDTASGSAQLETDMDRPAGTST